MANHVSSLKRARQTERKTGVNRANKSRVRSSLRAFHTEVLKDGSLPLGILDRKIDRWIESTKAVAKAG